MPKFVSITKKWGDKSIFDDFSLELPENKVSVILGESGVGKTTLLSIAASLTDFSGKTEGFENASFVFQEDRLIETLTARQNVLYALSSVAVDKRQKEEIVNAALKSMRADGYADRLVSTLSGGEKRRVALSRAFAYPSSVVLMDEPFNSLDMKLKKDIIGDIKESLGKNKKTVVMVTHSVDEAMFFGEYLVILKRNEGVIFGDKKAEDSFGYEEDNSVRKTIVKLLAE